VRFAGRARAVVAVLCALGFLTMAGSGAAARLAIAGAGDLAISYVSQSPGLPDTPVPTSISMWHVTNVGDAPVIEVSVSATFDEGSGPTQWRGSLQVVGDCCDCPGPDATGNGCSLSSPLAPGASFDVRVSYSADLSIGQTKVVVTALHVAGYNETNETNDTASAGVVNARPPQSPRPEPPPPPKLPAHAPQKVQMDTVATASASDVIVGDSVTIHYTITNTGNIEPTQYDFNPRVSGPAAVVSATPSAGQCAENNGMICKFGRLQPGVSVSVDLVLLATGPGPIAVHGIWVAEPGASPLWAYFFSSGGDSALTAVARSADLAAKLTIAQPRVRVGQRFTAQLRIADQGPDAMPAAAVRLVLPGVKLLAIQSANAACAVSKLRCTLGSLASGRAETLTLTLVATKPGSHTLTTALEATGFTDPAPANNQTSATLTVGRRRR
jgi:hypothetical protein